MSYPCVPEYSESGIQGLMSQITYPDLQGSGHPRKYFYFYRLQWNLEDRLLHRNYSCYIYLNNQNEVPEQSFHPRILSQYYFRYKVLSMGHLNLLILALWP